MGIRYYAYPVPAELVAEALREPFRFISDDPLADAWGPAEDRPTMLYLDKCWSYLQALTRPDFDGPPRPAYRLFEGEVTPVYDDRIAWIPWTRVLDPAEVGEVARDLALIDHGNVRTMLRQRPGARPDDYSYVAQYLADAREFAARMVEEGSGLVYLIG